MNTVKTSTSHTDEYNPHHQGLLIVGSVLESFSNLTYGSMCSTGNHEIAGNTFMSVLDYNFAEDLVRLAEVANPHALGRSTISNWVYIALAMQCESRLDPVMDDDTNPVKVPGDLKYLREVVERALDIAGPEFLVSIPGYDGVAELGIGLLDRIPCALRKECIISATAVNSTPMESIGNIIKLVYSI